MPEQIGEYRVVRQLGRGGMAEVFEAVAVGAGGFERTVCLKRTLSFLSSDLEFREMFVKEAQIAGKLCHSNLVQVFDCVEHESDLAIVMELVDGVDLKHLLEQLGRDTLPAELAVHIVSQVLQGLAYAHEKKIVHRDISPHNILISRHGEVKITDFGIAKVMQTHASRTGKLKGKLAYMSPEQARALAVDHRTDLYSTGLVFYELLKGRRFFEETNHLRLVLSVTNAERPTLTGVDPGLAAVVERLLEPNADARFHSADEALDALPPISRTAASTARELARFVRRHSGEASGAEEAITPSGSPSPPSQSQGVEPTMRVERAHKPTLAMWAASEPTPAPEQREEPPLPSPEPSPVEPTPARHPRTVRVNAGETPGGTPVVDTMETPTLVSPASPRPFRKPWVLALLIIAGFLGFLLVGLGIGMAARWAF